MIIDFDAILKRVRAILEANKELSKKVGIFRYGELSNVGYRLVETECHVYTPETALTTGEQYGRSTDSDRQYPIYVDIKINGFATDPEAAKRSLLENVKLITDTLTENRTLKNPLTGIDPLATRSFIVSVNELAKYRGKLAPIAIIHLKIQIGSEITMTIEGVGKDIPVLFTSTGTDMVGYASHLNTFGKLVGYAATGVEYRIRYYDLENTRNLEGPLTKLRRAKKRITYTVNESDAKIEYSGYIGTVSKGQAYDGTPMISLRLNVL